MDIRLLAPLLAVLGLLLLAFSVWEFVAYLLILAAIWLFLTRASRKVKRQVGQLGFDPLAFGSQELACALLLHPQTVPPSEYLTRKPVALSCGD